MRYTRALPGVGTEKEAPTATMHNVKSLEGGEEAQKVDYTANNVKASEEDEERLQITHHPTPS